MLHLVAQQVDSIATEFPIGQLDLLALLGAISFLVWAGMRGWLGSGAFAASPKRRPKLEPIEVFSAPLLYLSTLIFAGALYWLLTVDSRIAEGSSIQHLMSMLAGTLGLFLVLLIYALFRSSSLPRGKAWLFLGWWPRRPKRILVYGLTGSVAAILLTWSVGILIQGIAWLVDYELPRISHETLKMIVKEPESFTSIGVIFLVVTLVPLVEELLYRGVLQTSIVHALPTRGCRWQGVLIASALFSAMHLPVAEWYSQFPLFVLAVILGWLYEKTGSIWPSVMTHMVFNAFNIALLFVEEAMLPR